MNDAPLLMQVLQRLCNLCDDVPRQFLTEVCETDDLVKQFAAGRQFEDYVVVLARLGEVDEFDDVGVVDLAHDLNLLEDVRPL